MSNESADSYKMRSIVVDDVSSFIKATNELIDPDVTNLYRGQDRKRNLLPGVARKDNLQDTTNREKEVLAEFLRIALPHLPSEFDQQLDRLMHAQHYGLKTRLLDWTANPLFALWFACEKIPETGYVYSFNASADHFPKKYNIDPYASGATMIVKPRHTNPRLAAQDGWFTLHRYSATRSKKFVPLERNRVIKRSISEIVIKNPEDVLIELDVLGINSKLVYPDLQGLTSYMNWKHNF